MTPHGVFPIVERLGFQIAFLLAAVLLPLTVVSTVNSWRAVEEMRARSEAALTGETMQAGANAMRLIHEAQGAATAIAGLILPDLADPATCSAQLRRIVTAEPDYTQISYVPRDGRVSCSSTGQSYDVSASPAFKAMVQAARPSFAVARYGAISHTSVLVVSHPVLDGQGRFLGFVALSVPHSRLDVSVGISGEGRRMDLMTLDRTGAILAASVGLQKARAILPPEGQVNALVSDGPFAFTAMSAGGERRVYSVIPLIPGELFAVGTWRADLSGGVSDALITVPYLTPLLIWLASVVVAWLSVEWLVNRHIRRLNQSIKSFAGGDRAITETDFSGAPLELREMAAAFEQMTDAVMRDEAELEDTVHQKEVLLREVHHRVKNNLQMIASIMNMQARQATTPETRDVIKGLQGRVMSLATIHRWLYETRGVGDVDAAQLLEAIGRQAINVAVGRGQRFDLRLELDSILMTPDQAVPLALLVGEGLMDAAARTEPARHDVIPIALRLKQAGPDAARLEIALSAADTGGQRFDAQLPGAGFSMQLISIFAMQLGGTLQHGVRDGDHRLSLDFALRPLIEAENRHAASGPP